MVRRPILAADPASASGVQAPAGPRAAAPVPPDIIPPDEDWALHDLSQLFIDWYWELDPALRLCAGREAESRAPAPALAGDADLGKCLWELPWLGLPAAQADALRATLEAHAAFRDVEFRRLDPDGRVRQLALSGAPHFATEGRFLGYRGIARDTTVRRRLTLTLELEHRVVVALAEAASAPDALRTVLREVCETEGWLVGRYWAWDEAAGVFRLGESWTGGRAEVEDFFGRMHGKTFRAGEGLIGAVAAQREPLWVPDIAGDPRVVDLQGATGVGLRGACLFPVPLAGGAVAGVFAFMSPLSRAPDERLLAAVRTIGNQVGQFLQKNRQERALATFARRQSLMARFGQLALAATALDTLLEQAVATATEGLECCHAAILRAAADGAWLIPAAGTGWQEGQGGSARPRPAPVSPIQRAVLAGDPIIVDDLSAEPDLAPPPWFAALGIRSVLEVPIGAAEQPFGLFGVYAPEAARFTAESMSFLQSVANTLATAVARRDTEEKLAYLAQFDALTGLANRTLFRDRLGQSLLQAERNRWKVGVLYIDLDGFKQVNDRLGHEAGDMLLAQVAQRLRDCVRTSDTVGRLGGDEFAMVLPDLSAPEDAEAMARKVVAVLAQPFEVDGMVAAVGASIGIAIHPDDGADGETLLRNADAAMYLSKGRGGEWRAGAGGPEAGAAGTSGAAGATAAAEQDPPLAPAGAASSGFGPTSSIATAPAASPRLQMLRELRVALENDEFELHYQPQASLRTGKLAGVEALLRWRHPVRGLLAAGTFIDLAEQSGLIHEIGHWVLETACQQAATWRTAGYRDFFVAVNVSPMEIRAGDFPARVQAALDHSGLPPQMLEIELTETVGMDDTEPFIRALVPVKDLGVAIALDDFGTGYSCLSYLKLLPVDKLKIDRSFVRDVVGERADEAIVTAVVAMARAMGVTVTAEGVETDAQVAHLRQCGCDYVQGFLLGTPLPGEELARVLEDFGNERLLPDAPAGRRPRLSATVPASAHH